MMFTEKAVAAHINTERLEMDYQEFLDKKKIEPIISGFD